jgi:phage baseplate assembly protein V
MDYDTDLVFPRNKTGRDSEVRTMFDRAKVIEQCVDDTRVNVRVQLLDKDGIITKPIPVKQFGSKGNGAFWCPEVGDDVSVCFPPNSEYGDGFVDGSFYNTGNPPPVTDPNKRHITFKDGTVWEYDAGTHTMTFVSQGPFNIDAIAIAINGGTSVTVTATNIKLVGEVEIIGDVKIEGEIEHIGDMSTTGTHVDNSGTKFHV